ncbi:uncharacterized protein PAC_03968 [Phialocephala subalpina]|uniref:Uncharacterized protein n=1 Tax=Phialocephala subalpina TaxID=576137 RepID=A0A1L7WMT5_9HELO|nr:uncharacterized protein PAC_03968 [Phialocephala subalpina]
MSQIVKGNVEILVHTTAPSLGPDDARYRALAQAYLDFRPAKRRRLDDSPLPGPLNDINIPEESRRHEARRQSTQPERESEASWRPDEGRAESVSQSQHLTEFDGQDISEIIDSPELSFLSVMDNRTSPAFRGQVTCQRPASQRSTEELWQAPGSEVPDSQPEVHPTLAAFSSPTRILEVFLQNQDISQATTSPSGPSERRRPSGSVSVLSSSQRSPILRHIQNQSSSSRDHPGSDERSSQSSPRLPRTRNQQDGSHEIGSSNEKALSSLSDAVATNSSLSQTGNPGKRPERQKEVDSLLNRFSSEKLHTSSSEALPRNLNPEADSLEVGVGSKEPRLSLSQSHPRNRSQERGGLEVLKSNDNALTSSSADGPPINSSPSPVKNPTKRPEKVLRSKSPNAPLIQDSHLDKKRKHLSSIPETLSETRISSSAPPALALDELPPIPRPLKKQRLEPASSPVQPATSRSTESISSSPAGTAPVTKWSSLLEIRPPPPATSTSDLAAESLITPTLHQIATKMSLSRFRPASQSRDLRPMERGYWSISCAEWSEDTRNRCWNFLGDIIGDGRLGWGVWCVRDGVDSEFEGMRVYCWGGIMRHIWLLLVTASFNKVRKMAITWVDGGGECVVRMPE